MQLGVTRRLLAVTAASATLVIGIAACGDDSGSGGEADPAVVTIRVIDEEYRIELVTPESIENARMLLDGEEAPSIPNGVVVRDGDGGVNEPWSWHIDPASLEWADMTIEVCDGLPSDVEDDIITSDRYCPWSAEVIALDEP
jgi:hypothetical protein